MNGGYVLIEFSVCNKHPVAVGSSSGLAIAASAFGAQLPNFGCTATLFRPSRLQKHHNTPLKFAIVLEKGEMNGG